MFSGRVVRQKRSRSIREEVWPAPVFGLIQSGTLVGSRRDGAEVLENFIPTAQGARLRGGSVKFATVPGPVKSLMTYKSGVVEQVFAATETAIYDVSSVADVDVAPAADISGLSGGDWSSTQFSTSGGEFLIAANGVNPVRRYDGSAWSSPSITGVASGLLSFVWSHASRLWFVEKGTLSAWYLPVQSIAGGATEFPLASVFTLGGSLLFGGRWSRDAGDGPDDYCVFVTTEGEIAIYAGTDPNSAATWSLVGLYRIGKPLGKNAWFDIGGDLVILTEDGVIPLSQAQATDRAALQSGAITAPIEDLWNISVSKRSAQFGFCALVWPDQTLAIVTVPDENGAPSVLMANTRTGGWARTTGWDVRCMTLYGGQLLFGTNGGAVVAADQSGADQGAPYTGRFVPKFQEMGSPEDKIAVHARIIWQARGRVDPRLACFSNYQIGTYPTAGSLFDTGSAVWGASTWGGAKWGASANAGVGEQWQTVYGQGFALAPVLCITSQQVEKPDFSIVSTSLRYEIGSSV